MRQNLKDGNLRVGKTAKNSYLSNYKVGARTFLPASVKRKIFAGKDARAPA